MYARRKWDKTHKHRLGNSSISMIFYILRNYKDLMNTIEVQRLAFKNAQEKEIDIIREHEMLLKTMPSCWFISDKRPIEYTVVSSTKSKMTMETGLDDDVELFKK